MKMALYYIVHTFKNQIRKLLKTWVAIFIAVCVLIGALMGFGAGVISDMSSDDEPAQVEQSPEDDSGDFAAELSPGALFADADTAKLLEAVGALIVVAVILFCVFTSHNSGNKIFTMSDVNFLFSAPIKPQSILLFKLVMKMGTMLVATIYLLFQIPNLIYNVGLPSSMAWVLLGVWFLTLVFAQLISVLLYTLSSTHDRLQKNVKNIVYGVLALLVVGFIFFWRSGGGKPVSAATDYLSTPWMRLIPIWGWLKAIIYHAAVGHTMYCIYYTTALIVLGGILIYIIWHLKADFYEDAMTASEQTAAIINSAKESGTLVTSTRRKKERSEKLDRDGFTKGNGASVYFYKTMYNRFRFAKLRYFTTTCVTYAVAAVLVSLLCKYVFITDSPIPVMLVLAVMVFFRSLGDPISGDAQQAHFSLVPDSAFKKVMYSLLGGAANCLLDLIPALVICCVVTGGSVLTAFMWMVLIVSIDLYASSVGAFITLSLPTSLPKTIHQMIQILFIYFGLIPLAALIAIGIVTDSFVLFSLLALVFDVAISALFIALCPHFIVRGRR
ncbi:MAG: putative ABC exporter domain-containing protein [Oscillospiraceae bacterium]|nr:putative ABC exporter domain-containing protein [Oscillospiraceae bacterium]